MLDLYQNDSGQLINAHKSGYLVHPQGSVVWHRVIEKITNFKRKGFPVRYLGSPLYFGRCKSAYFAYWYQAIANKVFSWKSQLLSHGGKISLIKHVLSSIPVHLLTSGVMSKGTFHIIEKVCENFLWGTYQESNKFHWVGWWDLCYPPEEVDVGFRSIYESYRVFSCKLW